MRAGWDEGRVRGGEGVRRKGGEEGRAGEGEGGRRGGWEKGRVAHLSRTPHRTLQSRGTVGRQVRRPGLPPLGAPNPQRPG